VTVSDVCRRHRRIAIDANVLVHVLDATEPRAGVGGAFLDAFEAGTARGVMSVVGLAEITVGPARTSDPAHLERYVDEARSIEGLDFQPVTTDIAVDAGILRGVRGLRLADAIHLASARAAGATAFVTNDRRLRSSAHLEVVYLDDLAVDEDPTPSATPA
jgi:predicted nucleic acid-binding protein